MIRILIFDIGKVLVNINVDRFVQKLTTAIRISRFRLFLFNQFNDFNGLMQGEQTAEDIYEKLCQHFKSDISLAHFKEIWISMLDSPKLDVVEIVEKLASKYQVVLLSNIEAWHYEHLVRTMPVLKTFSPHFLSYQLKLQKPMPAIYLKVLQELKAKPAECFFVDDQYRNVKAARKLGICSHQFKNFNDFKKTLSIHNLL